MVSKAEEFSEFRYHQGEKAVLKAVSKSTGIRYPHKGNFVKVSHKVFMMIQVYFECSTG